MLDFIGATASLLSTYYFIRLHSNAWVVSLFAICVNSYLYWQKGIYADMGLEFFYFITTCYGWFLWSKPKKIAKKIKSLSNRQWFTLVCAVLSLFLIIRFILLTYTNSSIATLDALTTALSLAAQWLMCHKLIATWILWFLTDALYVYMYLQKHIPFHAFQMLIYTLLAIAGYYTWHLKSTANRNLSNYLPAEPRDLS